MPNGTFVETGQLAARTSRWGALRHRDFRLFWLARGISTGGDNISFLALPSAAILVLGAGPGQVGALRAVQFVAYPLLGIVAGVWVDRLRRRRIMVVADGGRAIALASIPIAFGLGHLTLAQLFVVVAIVGALTVFFDLASTAQVPAIVPRQDWLSANAQLEMAVQAITMGGPGLAGALITALTAPFAIAFNAVTYLASATLLRGTSDPKAAASTGGHALAGALEGLRFLVRNRALLRITMTAAISNVGLMAAQAALLLFLYREKHLAAYVIGLAFGAGSAASFIGAAANQAVLRRLRTHRALLLATFVEALGWLMFPFGFFLPMVPLLFGGLVVAGFFNVTWNVGVTTFRQQQIPGEMMGRVSAASRAIGYGALPVGSLLGGVLGQVLVGHVGQGPGLALTLAVGALIAAGSVLPLLSPEGFEDEGQTVTGSRDVLHHL